ncbi:MAG TPA: hypothetical protein VNL36_02695, partial [Bacteroidota bacterium]|nr:hypothetical protein [Bacteroidota bacterium]
MLPPRLTVGNQPYFFQTVSARLFSVLLVLSVAGWMTERLHAQIVPFPYTESFDTVAPPALPSGWLTSTARAPSGDFATTTSTPRSAPNAVLSTNATISQSLTSPTFNFTNRTPDKLQFYTAR